MDPKHSLANVPPLAVLRSAVRITPFHRAGLPHRILSTKCTAAARPHPLFQPKRTEPKK